MCARSVREVAEVAQIAAVVGLSIASELFFGVAVFNVLMRSHCDGRKRGDGGDDSSEKTTTRHLHKDERKKDWKESCARGGGSSLFNLRLATGWQDQQLSLYGLATSVLTAIAGVKL